MVNNMVLVVHNDLNNPLVNNRLKTKTGLSPVGLIFLLTHQFIVVFMAADPKPKEPVGNLNSNSPIMNSDTDRPITANFLQV